MRSLEHTELLADAAAGLSRQLQAHLRWMGKALVTPSKPPGKLLAELLARRFEKRLREMGHGKPQREALIAITTGAAARIMYKGKPAPEKGVKSHGMRGRGMEVFLEEVQYRGRRLAKLGLNPAAVVAALQEYDQQLRLEFERRFPDQMVNLDWVLGQLHFLVLLTLNSAFYQVRETESQTFYELFRAEVESRTLDEMLPRFLAVLMNYTGASEGRLYLLDADSGEWRARASQPRAAVCEAVPPVAALRTVLAKPSSVLLRAGGPEFALETGWRKTFKTCWSVPLLSHRKLSGVLQFAFPKEYGWLPRELDLLSAAAERCWLAAEKARLMEDLARREEQVRRLAEHMVEVEESERRRISRELHDEAGQSLLCVRLQMEMLEQDMPAGCEPWRQRLVEAREMTEHTIVEIRRLIAALSPAVLEQIGLAAALRQLIARFRRLHPAEVQLHLPRRLELPKKVEIIVYRLIQEIFNNIAKYSLATHVNLSVDSADGCLRLIAEDNGVGFDVVEAFARRDCFGLSGLRERVALLGGKLEVVSLPTAKSRELAGEAERTSGGPQKEGGQIGVGRQGTSIRAELPLKGHIAAGIRMRRENWPGEDPWAAGKRRRAGVEAN
ncbi:MAG: GAF domain-containing sensor histidine kinase [Candidatus Solibacter usitatus]|nr:GAF domain-containing sensor histidine kinase [Candidatus Solibacter usitatus]